MEIVEMNRKVFTIYEFPHPFEIVWPIIKDVRITNLFCDFIDKNRATDPIFLKGSSSSELDAEFHFKWKNKFEIYFRVEEVIETDYYGKLKWKAFKTEPQTLPYYFIYNLHKSSEDSCLMGFELLYVSNVKMKKKDEEKGHSERWSHFYAIDKCISMNGHLKYQGEFVHISAEIEIIWKIISNFKMFRTFVPIICDKVEYDGERVQTGTRMTFTWNNSQESTMAMVVTLNVVRVEETATMCIVIYECFDINSLVPRQSVEWRVNKITENECMMSVIHKFEEAMSLTKLELISAQKIKILKKLKQTAEKFSKMIKVK